MLEDLSVEYPRDALALRQALRSTFHGDSRMLRDASRAPCHSWDASLKGYHAVLGMHAFGMEETGD